MPAISLNTARAVTGLAKRTLRPCHHRAAYQTAGTKPSGLRTSTCSPF